MDWTVGIGIVVSWVILVSGIHSTNGYAYNQHIMQENCSNKTEIFLKDETSLYGFVHLTRGNDGYEPNLYCRLIIWAPDHYKITTRFDHIDIFKPDDGCSSSDRLELSGNKTTHVFCGRGTPSYSLISSGKFLELEFYSGDHDFENTRIGFSLYYTAFHQGPCDTLDGNEFECYRDYRCIPGELTCDNLDNCGDWSDERSATCGLPAGTITMITLMSILCCGVCIAAGVYFCIDKKRDTRRRARRNPNNVVPSVEYNCNQTFDPNAPPPYSSHFTTPAYTEQKEQPPAYNNYGFENNVTAAPTNINAETPVTQNNATPTSPSISNHSSVVTPPTGSRNSSVTSVQSEANVDTMTTPGN